MQIAKCWDDETAFRKLYNIRKVLSVIRSEADDESATVDVWKQWVSVRMSGRSVKLLSQTNKMINENLNGS